MKKYFFLAITIIIVLFGTFVLKNSTKGDVDFESLSISKYSDKDIAIDSNLDEYSKISFVKYSDSVKFEFILNNAYAYPYAGLELTFDTTGFVDFSKFKDLKLVLRTENITALNVYLIVEDSSIEGFRYLVRNIEVEPSVCEYEIEYESFRTPVWWIDEHKSSEVMPNTNVLKRVKSIQIESAGLIGKNLEGVVVIKKIETGKLNISHTIKIFSSLIFLILVCFFLRKKIGNPIRKNRFKNLSEAEQKVRNCIKGNYFRPNISVEIIANKTEIEQDQVRKIVKNLFNTSLKSHINEIRLKEATRLLCESDRNISEIAYSVGFGNISHFNRIFKTIYRCSPSEYRQRIYGKN